MTLTVTVRRRARLTVLGVTVSDLPVNYLGHRDRDRDRAADPRPCPGKRHVDSDHRHDSSNLKPVPGLISGSPARVPTTPWAGASVRLKAYRRGAARSRARTGSDGSAIQVTEV